MSDVPELVQQLEGFVELIAAAIDSRDWDGLNDLLVNRQEALEQLCALPLSPLELKTAVNVMVSMQSTDKQLLELVQSQKEELQKQAASFAHDRKAIQAYQSE
ncbi:MAG: flagellar protein FliT [Methylobacter sp.]|nr:flagellar protein FliT [Methylobacter sp.]